MPISGKKTLSQEEMMKELEELEELEELLDALYNGEVTNVDHEGVVHLDDETNLVKNGVEVPEGVFGGAPLSQAEEMNDLADALYNGDTMVVDEYGVVHLDDGTNVVENGKKISEGIFAGEALSQAEEISDLADALYNDDDGIVVDGDGVMHLNDDTNTIENGQRISKGKFASAPVMPSDPDEWYNKNDHRLFRTEVEAMRKAFPKAGFGFMKSTGNMYWIIDMNISQSGFAQTWRFMLVYDKDHPHNNSYGGSIKARPIRPNEADIQEKARKYGRPGVPHLLHNDSLGTYLCTRRTEDVKDGTREANTAVSVATWAADWALHFEVGIRDKRVWNKWCDDAHFRHLMI